jgi:hypothetical protein
MQAEVANRPAQDRMTCLERVDHSAQRSGTLRFDRFPSPQNKSLFRNLVPLIGVASALVRASVVRAPKHPNKLALRVGLPFA